MSKWPTIEEILSSPIEIKRHDPFFHTHKYPKFMKRRVILSESYEKKVIKRHIEANKTGHRRTVSENSPNLIGFKPYGRVIEKVKSIFEKDSVKGKNSYDEAQEQQIEFRNMSPKAKFVNSDYKISFFPRETTADPLKNRKKDKKNKSQSKIPRKVFNKVDPELQSLTKSNVLVLLSKQMMKKCEICAKAKCVCEVIDEEIPEVVYENIKKGKNLIEKARAEKKERKIKTSLPKRELMKTQPKGLVFESLLDELWKLPKKDPNTIEGVQLILHRRLSSEGERKCSRPSTQV